MPDPEVRGSRALYDHETDDGRPARRRRPVADWGVGEEMFDHLPRRRFRPSEGTQRRDVHPDGQRRDTRRREATEGSAAQLPARPDAAPAEPQRPRLDHGAETVELSTVDAERPATTGDSPEPGTFSDIDTLAHPGEGRRTIVIRGRGSEPAVPPRRERPPRTAGERIGARPERLAAWAVALGVLLIVIAILSAQ